LKEREHFEDINFIFENNTIINVKVVLWARYGTQNKKLHSIVIYSFTTKILKLQIVTIHKIYPQGESNNQICFNCKVIYRNAMHFVDSCITNCHLIH